MKSTHFLPSITFAALSLTSLSSNAAVVYEWVGGTGAVPATAPVSGDLLETSLSTTTGISFGIPFNDGVVNPSNNNPGGTIIFGAGSDTFNLDVTTNPLGYDISEINIYTGWNDARAGQHYTIAYTPVGGTLTTINIVNDADDVSFTASNGSLRSSSFNLGLTGVESITITPVTGALNSSGSVPREIDVIGAPTVVPEPSAYGMLLGGLGLLTLLRRRKA